MAFDDGPPGSSDWKINFLKEAFHIQYNWIALGAAGAFALVSGSFLPLMLAAGAELVYLAIVPNNPRFQRMVRSWKLAEEKQLTQQNLADLLKHLPGDLQTRYIRLAEVCGGIRSNFAQLSSTSQIFVQQMDSRLEGLLHGYARLLQAAYQQRQYVKTVDPDGIRNEAAALQKHLSSDPPKVQDINKKRIEILTKRLEKYQKICENRQVIDAQVSAMEDVLQLVRDQSITMRDPQQVSDQLENLVHDVEQTEETVKQVEAIFNNTTQDLDGIMSSIPQDTSTNSTGPLRTKIRS
jgi:archaellum component FlaC